MALLLAMYQKMRLIREKNQATYDLTKFSSKYDRVSKNIERVNKRYTSLFAKLESDAKRMQSNAKNVFQQIAGLGTGSFNNFMNPMGFTGMNGFIMQRASEFMATQGMPIFLGNNSDGKAVNGLYTIDANKIPTLMQLYNQNGGRILPETDNGEDGKTTTKTEERVLYKDLHTEKGTSGTKTKVNVYPNGITEEDVRLFNYAIQQAQNLQYQTQAWVSNMGTQYDNTVSIWLDARKAELEAEQDAALEPLNYQQTMWELEKTQAEAKLERIKANLESYNSLVSEEIKNSAPKFGLG